MGKKLKPLIQPRGVNYDQPDEFIPPEVFTGGVNISMRNNRVQRVGGFAPIWDDPNPLPIDPIHLMYAPFQGTGYWCILSNVQIYATTGTTHTEITPAAGIDAGELNSWTSSELNGLAVFNNNESAPFYWPGSPQAICLPLPDFPADQCYALRPYKFHLVAMGPTGAGGLDDQIVLWSDAAAPGQVPQSWTPGVDSEAGDNVLGDETGAIIDGLALRDDFIIYKQRSIYVMSYIGGDAVMGFRKLFTNLGALNRNCIAEHKGMHYVMGDGDLFVHDGHTIQSIADGILKDSFFELLDPNFFRGCYVAINKVENEVYFCAPIGGIPEARLGIIYDIDADAWGVREIPSCPYAASGTVAIGTDVPDEDTWDDVQSFWQFSNYKWNASTQILGTVTDGLLFAQPSGPRIMFLDASVTNRGLTIDARLDWLTNDMGTPDVVKVMRRITPRFVAPPGTEITVRAGAQVELKDGIDFESTVFTVGEDKSVDVLVSGKYLSVQFESEVDVAWELTGFGLEYEERGMF